MVRRVVFLTLSFAMITDAALSADLQINGSHVRNGAIPFSGGNMLLAESREFIPPSDFSLQELKAHLETDLFRSIAVCDASQFPAGCAAHLSTFWRLRLIDGYSLGVPRNLAVFPWPSGVHNLRNITFRNRDGLPWDILALLNVKYALVVNKALYRNYVEEVTGIREARSEDLEILPNPGQVTPRIFFAQRIEPVLEASDAVSRLLDGPLLPNPEEVSYVEGIHTPMAFSVEGHLSAIFNGDQVEIELEAALEPRFLVINERPHPGWHAYIGKEELPVYSTNAAMRGILVPPKVTSVILRFMPFGSGYRIIFFPCFGVILLIGGILILKRFEKDLKRDTLTNVDVVGEA